MKLELALGFWTDYFCLELERYVKQLYENYVEMKLALEKPTISLGSHVSFKAEDAHSFYLAIPEKP